MTDPGDTMRGPRPVVDGEHDDAPQASHHETPSKLIVRAATEAVKIALERRGESSGRWAASHPLAMRSIRGVGRAVGYLAIAVLGAAGVVVVDQDPAPAVESSGPDCDPDVLRHILHLAATGEALALELDSVGEHRRARLVRDMTDVNKLPNDLQLCVLLEKRTGETTR